MAKEKIIVEVDFKLLEQANSILAQQGQTLQNEISQLLQKIINEANQNRNRQILGANYKEVSINDGRKYSKITEEMCQSVWRAFIICVEKGRFDFSRSVRDIEVLSGMRGSSALLYLNILRNLCMGEKNTRNMKINDLRFFLGKIEQDLDDRAMENAKISLGESIPYWQEKIVGGYAEKVEDLLEEF